MMTCREVVDFLMDYLSGSLAPEERQEFERHLEACPPCISYLKTYERTVALGKKACCKEGESVAEKVPEDLVKAILAAKRKK